MSQSGPRPGRLLLHTWACIQQWGTVSKTITHIFNAAIGASRSIDSYSFVRVATSAGAAKS